MSKLSQYEQRRFLFLAQREENERAKLYWLVSNFLEAGVLTIGILTFFTDFQQVYISVFAIALGVASFMCRWSSDTLKDKSQDILRNFEYADGLAWPLSQKEISDTKNNLPIRTLNRINSSKEKLDWFASTEKKGHERLLESFAQSVCWTKSEAKLTLRAYIGITIIILLIGIILLFAGVFHIIPDSEQPIARTVIAIFAFMFTGGYIRLCWDYWQLYRDTEKIDDAACTLLEAPQITNDEVVKLYMDYLLVRAKAPLLPTWVYKRLKPQLEATCKRVRRKP